MIKLEGLIMDIFSKFLKVCQIREMESPFDGMSPVLFCSSDEDISFTVSKVPGYST